MTTPQHIKKELEDKAQKLRSAKEAAAAPEASERDKSDLKIIEQEYQAEKQKAAREAAGGSAAKNKTDDELDRALKDSFPGSDPVAITEPAPKKQ